MIFRIRLLLPITGAIVVATIAAWFSGALLLIYMMPLLALAAFHLSLACPRCRLSPYTRMWGPFVVGLPWLPKDCPNCGFAFHHRLGKLVEHQAVETVNLPIRNYTDAPVTLFIEPYCAEHELPAGGEAVVTLEKGFPHSIDIHPDRWLSLWDEGSTALARVEIFPDHHSLMRPDPEQA